MQKQPWGSACKVCERPFTSFRWRPAGQRTRPKKTEICQTCARAKNVCQTCLLDLEYGLPVQVRDASMAAGDRQRALVPKSDGTREYAAAQSERAIASGQVDAVYTAPKVNDIAERAKRITPRYERNRSRICSFFLKGACTRGLYCPYRHEKPKDVEDDADEAMEEQNLRDRYYGVNDPVASKIFRKLGVSVSGRRSGAQGPTPPDDPTIQTLFIGGLNAAITESDLKLLFAECKGLSSISMVSEKSFAFAEFESRKAAEQAIDTMYGKHLVNGTNIFVNWGRGNRKRQHQQSTDATQLLPSANEGSSEKATKRQISATTEPGAKKPRLSQPKKHAWDLLEVANSKLPVRDQSET
ncbi:RNA-binding protein [Gracilaria domingensis]|nr:RNA-binding protein [Gracilaria domingensis]